MGVLYDAVGFGMRAYARSAFRVRELAPPSLRLRPGTLVVSTHRRETDVPLLAQALYFHASIWRHRDERMSFAARDDLFLRGFFAGFPPGLSPRVRKALYPLGVGSMLPRIQVYPLRSASLLRLGEVFRQRPDALLADLAGDEVVAGFRRRASERGLPEPLRAGDALGGDYADLLWRTVTREELDPRLDDLWGRRAAHAAADFRALVDLVRAGGSLVVFPEGRPSPDGQIGPLRRGLAALVRRARPPRILPVTLAYDPLVRGRTIALVALGEAVAPPEHDVESEVLALLRRLTPLTCGQVVAHRLVAGELPGAAALEADLARAVEEAGAEGRPVDPELADPARRRSRVEAALEAARGRATDLTFLAREYESARARPS